MTTAGLMVDENFNLAYDMAVAEGRRVRVWWGDVNRVMPAWVTSPSLWRIWRLAGLDVCQPMRAVGAPA